MAANNHYGGYGPGTVDIFRKNMDLETLSFENVDVGKITRELQLEARINLSEGKSGRKGRQTTMSDFVE